MDCLKKHILYMLIVMQTLVIGSILGFNPFLNIFFRFLPETTTKKIQRRRPASSITTTITITITITITTITITKQ
jgi:hypothetical protein